LTRGVPLSIKNVDEGNNDRHNYPSAGRKEKKREKNGNPGKSDQLVFIAHRDLE